MPNKNQIKTKITSMIKKMPPQKHALWFHARFVPCLFQTLEDEHHVSLLVLYPHVLKSKM